MKRAGYIIIILIILNTGCAAQISPIQLKAVDNDDLKFALLYLECGEKSKEKNGYGILKNIKLTNYNEFVYYEDELTIYKEFYYFIEYTVDEFAHLEATLYKTDSHVEAKVEEVNFYDDEILVTISYVKSYPKEYPSGTFEMVDNLEDFNRESVVLKIRR